MMNEILTGDFLAYLQKTKPLPKLEPFQPYAKMVSEGYRTFPRNWKQQVSIERTMLMHLLKKSFNEEYGYVLATSEVMAGLAEILRPAGRVLDAGSGSGYLSKELSVRGVKMQAVDSTQNHGSNGAFRLTSPRPPRRN